jgi:hypothetical protein
MSDTREQVQQCIGISLQERFYLRQRAVRMQSIIDTDLGTT